MDSVWERAHDTGMKSRFVAPANLSPGYLTSETPIGLFHSPQENGDTVRFLVGDLPVGRHALALDPSDSAGSNAFLVHALSPGGTRWAGVSCGLVELEIDIESAKDATSRDVDIGDVVTSSAGVAIQGQFDGWKKDRLRFPIIGDRPAYHDNPVIKYTDWRLIQRDYDNTPVILFQRVAGGK